MTVMRAMLCGVEQVYMHGVFVSLLPLQAVVKPPMAVTNAVSWRSEGIRSIYIAQHAVAAVDLRFFQPRPELG